MHIHSIDAVNKVQKIAEKDGANLMRIKETGRSTMRSWS
jgi:hypothetical protein